MGATSSYFSKEELESYEACTCLLAGEVEVLYTRFRNLEGRRDGARKGDAAGQPDNVEGGKVDGREGIKVKLEKLLEEPELRNNPFRVRLCQVFSTEPVGSPTWGDLSFDEFVDLFNCECSARAASFRRCPLLPALLALNPPRVHSTRRPVQTLLRQRQDADVLPSV